MVFVYGTLKRGFYNHTKLMADLIRSGDASFIGDYTTSVEFPMVCGPYGIPYLINLPGSGHRVRGELYSVSSSVGLARLDDLEGTHRSHYERLPLTVVRNQDDAGLVEAEAYFAHREFGEALWKRCGQNLGLTEFTMELGSKYVRREDRISGSTSIRHDLDAFISN